MNKTLKLIYFAHVREVIGASQETWQTQANTIAELRSELAGRGDGYAQALTPQQVLRYGVNQYMVDADTAVEDGDEVAFFPPVTGG